MICFLNKRGLLFELDTTFNKLNVKINKLKRRYTNGERDYFLQS